MARSSELRRNMISGAGLFALDVIIKNSSSSHAATFAGGTCGNVLAIMSHLGWHAQPLGRIGNDVAGHRLHTDLQACGVDVDFLTQDSNTPTPVYFQTLEQQEHGMPWHNFSASCPVCGTDLRSNQDWSIPTGRNITSFGQVLFLDRISPDIVKLIDSATQRGAIIVYEPSSLNDRAFWDEVIPKVHILKYSKDRFREEDFAAHSRIPSGGWEIQTLGKDGLVFRETSPQQFGAWKQLKAFVSERIVDSCGAGDWCTAGLIHSLIKDEAPLSKISPDNFEHALRMGQALATIACAFEGARGAMYRVAATDLLSIAQKIVDGHVVTTAELPPPAPDSSHQATSVCGKSPCSPVAH